MATSLVVRTLPIARDELRKFLPNSQLIKAFENLAQDVSETIPSAIDGNTTAVALAQATANSAIVQATAAQATADTALSNAATAQSTVDALALRDVPLPLVDAATILVNAVAHNSFSVTLGGNRTLDAPSNLANGMLLNFAIKQDGTGGRTLAFNAIYDFGAAGTPVMSTTPGVTDYVSGYYDAVSAKILCSIRKADSTAASFSAHNNGVAQSIPTGLFTKLTFSTELFDTGNRFAASTWTPPAGRPVMLIGHMTIPTVANSQALISIYKNGAEFKRGTQAITPTIDNVGVHVSCIDVPNGTDTYDLWAFQNAGASKNTDGTSTTTYFQATTITP